MSGTMDTDEKTPLLDTRKVSNRRRTNILLYCSHVLSAWGDRMWQFGVGMFLVTIDPTSLRLTAIYGFASGGAILLLGAIVGDWVDKNQRLPVARTSLLLQNIAVTLSAVGVCFWIYYEDAVKEIWGGRLDILLQVLIVAFAVVADVASMGRQIAIERDWIVVICENDNQALTDMSAFLRSIDLTTNLLAPIVTGQVMTYGSMLIGGIFIAAWNVVFFLLEYGMLYAVYKSVPDLAVKKTHDPMSESHAEVGEKDTKSSLVENMFKEFITLKRGWATYSGQRIVYAGVALSFLYMTVLGFDNITTGFAKEQGLSESLISILLATGALAGVLGTVVFPHVRKAVGLERTGLIAFSIENMCLLLCVLSVFAPGSPFQPGFLISGGGAADCLPVSGDDVTRTAYLQSISDDHSSLGLIARSPSSLALSNSTNPHDCTVTEPPGSPMSIILLMAGIVSSRFGLWMADLTVTQLLLESPAEHERGIINGVQNSLNRLMDILKSLLVVFLPWPQTFGYLVIVSYVFIFVAAILFAVYSRQMRGHLFHFERYEEDQKKNRIMFPEVRFDKMYA